MNSSADAYSVREVVLRELQEASADPVLIAGFEKSTEPELLAWKEAINESPYGPRDWALSLVCFDAWARSRGLEISLERMRGYLACCVEGAGPQTSLLPLEALLAHYLETQGVR
jgi:hypothetical protein